jgi:hypothetical protein
MKAEDIVAQLQSVLPKVTDLFSDKVTISSLTRAGTTVTAVTSSAHGLSVGNEVTVTGAQTPVSISELTFADGVATATTATRHDLTEKFEDGIANDNPNAAVSGATEGEYNGENPLLTVPNRNKFTYTVVGTPSTPATGTPLLLQQFNSGYNGRKTVATVPDTTTFTYEITETPDSPAQGSPEVHTAVRASRSVSIEKAREAYTKKAADKLWAIVILGDPSPSKNRNVESDATDTQGAGTEYRQRIILPFSTFVFVPTTQEIAGAAARDQMEDVRPFLFKALLDTKFTTGMQSDTEYGVIYEGDLFFDYNGAVYIHQFSFSTVTDIISEDTVDPDENVAFRDVNLEFLDEFDTVELSATVDLDEEPN